MFRYQKYTFIMLVLYYYSNIYYCAYRLLNQSITFDFDIIMVSIIVHN